MHLKNEKSSTIVLVLLAIIALARPESSFKLECSSEPEKSCTLISKEDGEVKPKHMICVDTECKESLLFSDNNLFACQNMNKKSGDCQKIQIKNVGPFQSALSDLYRANLDQNLEQNMNAVSELEQIKDPILKLFESKRNLPFESLNYGRKRRNLPFEVLNYGKRSGQNCDCSSKRALPFESILYGKRALPFESLNYGKRAYIPIDGYIMGKREE